MLRLTDRMAPNTRSRSASSSARPMQPGSSGGLAAATGAASGAAIQVTSPPKPTFKPGTYIYEVDRTSNTIHKYRCGRVLGRGGFAKCYEVSDEQSHYALKVVDRTSLSKPKTLQKLHSEIAIHRRMKHPHVVRFIRTFKDPYYVYMLLEICENGTLMDLLKVRPLNTAEAQYVMLQCLQALQYMHDSLVIHRDLKPGNIMLDRELNVKIGDFGLAAELQYDGERKRTVCGTPNYIAPEIIDRHAQGHSYEVDTWSLGVMLYTLLVGQPPFQMEDVEATYSRIRQCRYDFPSSLSETARDLIEHILQSSPSHRATLIDIRTHAFFAQPVPPTLPPVSFAAFRLAHTEVLRRQQGLSPAASASPLCGTASPTAAVVQRRVSAPAECCYAVPQSVKERVDTMREVLRPMNPNVHEPRKPVPPLLSACKPPSRRIAALSAPPPEPESTQHDYTYDVPLYRPPPSAAATRRRQEDVAAKDKENVAVRHAEPELGRRRGSAATPSEEGEEDEAKLPSQREVRSPRRAISPRAPRAQLVEDEDEHEVHAELTRMHDELHRTLCGDALPTAATDKAVRPTSKCHAAAVREDKEHGPASGAQHTEGNAAGPARAVPRPALTSAEDRVTRSPAESPVPAPQVWLTHCADFSSKYGLCYRLNTGHTGAHFNDSTKMVWQPVTNRVEYYARVKVELPVASASNHNNNNHNDGAAGGTAVYARDELHAFDLSDSPAALEKKITLIKYFKSYLSRAHTSTNKDKVQVVRCSPYCDPTAARLADPHVAEDFVYVKRWLQTDEALVFRLSNKTVQVCFRDGAEVLLCSEWKVVTYTSPAGLRRTLPLNEVAMESAEAAARLRYTKSILYQLIQDRCL